MITNNEFKAIAELDLDPIKVKLMHKESGQGWSLGTANAVEFEYRRFLCLMKKFPNEQTAPSVDVDTFWHYHILDTMKYAADCEQVFGYFLHHFPYIGLRGADDHAERVRAGTRMQTLYQVTFGAVSAGLDQESAAAAWCGAPNVTAWCGSPRQVDERFSGAAAANTAWCGSPVQMVAAANGMAAANTAWCGAPQKVAEARTASVAANTAWCGAPVQMVAAANGAVAANTAWCGAPAQPAWCGSPRKQTRGDYSEGPALASA
jgi:hypothetical protein